MEIGLDLVAVYEDGLIYDKSVLSVDEAQTLRNVLQAHKWAFNLAVEAGIYSKDVVEFMIEKAEREAMALQESKSN